mgnify:CR=1 FL=1
MGGLPIFDNLGDGRRPPDTTPGRVLDSFLTAFSNDIEVIHQRFQIIVKKVKNPCGVHACTVFGNYLFFLYNDRLVHRDTGERVKLTKDEAELVSLYLTQAKKNGEASNRIVGHLLKEPDFQKLQKKLGLKL